MRITVSTFEEANENARIDSQFFHPEYLSSYERVLSSKYSTLSSIAHITDGNHLKIAQNFDDKQGIRYLRGQDLSTDMILDDRNIVYIPETEFAKLSRSHIYENDVLVTIVGANTGLVGLVYDPPEKLVANCKLGILRAQNNEIPQGYLYAFLIGRYGQHQLLRAIRGGGQTGLILPDLRDLKIVRLSTDFEALIHKNVLKAHEFITKSKRVYFEAEEYLLLQLGLNRWEPKHRLSFVRNFADTIGAKRIDAEYYQPKYDEVIKAIKSNSSKWDHLRNLVKMRKGVEVGSQEYLENGVPFVRISNLNQFDLTQEKCISHELYNTLTKYQPKKGEILLSKDGSPGIAYYLDEQPQKMIPASGILRLKLKSDILHPEYLMVVLNSLVVHEQINRDVGGSVILHWRPSEVKQTLIPILSEDKQLLIKDKVNKSIDLRNKSRQLLAVTKHAIEIAIETSEENSLAWFDTQLNDLD